MGQPFKPYSPKEVNQYIESLRSQNASLRQELEDTKADLADAQADLAVAKADAAELKQEREDFKNDPDVQALKAMNQTAFMSQTATDRDIMFFKFCKAI